MKKIQIFLSSRFSEFAELREKIISEKFSKLDIGLEVNALDGRGGIADTRSPALASIEEADGSDIFILLLGETYGSIPNGYSKSYTHMEYETALKKGLKILAFPIGDAYVNGEYSKDPMLNKWQKDVLVNNSHITATPYPTTYDIDEVYETIYRSLQEYVNRLVLKKESKEIEINSKSPFLSKNNVQFSLLFLAFITSLIGAFYLFSLKQSIDSINKNIAKQKYKPESQSFDTKPREVIKSDDVSKLNNKKSLVKKVDNSNKVLYYTFENYSLGKLTSTDELFVKFGSPTIVKDYKNNQGNSLFLHNTSSDMYDQIELKLQRGSSTYTLNYNMFIPDNNKDNVVLLIDTLEIRNIYFHKTGKLVTYLMDNIKRHDNDVEYPFKVKGEYPQNRWFNVNINIDLDKRFLIFKIDGKKIFSTKFIPSGNDIDTIRFSVAKNTRVAIDNLRISKEIKDFYVEPIKIKEPVHTEEKSIVENIETNTNSKDEPFLMDETLNLTKIVENIEGSEILNKEFLIAMSTSNYTKANKYAKHISKILNIQFDERLKGRSSDGVYITIEESNNYKQLKNGYYIVVVASGKSVYKILSNVKKVSPTSYIKKATVTNIEEINDIYQPVLKDNSYEEKPVVEQVIEPIRSSNFDSSLGRPINVGFTVYQKPKEDCKNSALGCTLN